MIRTTNSRSHPPAPSDEWAALKRWGHLKRHLLQRPSRRIVEALARVADEEAIVLLARTGRARRELTGIVIAALEEIESPRALDVADRAEEFSRQAG